MAFAAKGKGKWKPQEMTPERAKVINATVIRWANASRKASAGSVRGGVDWGVDIGHAEVPRDSLGDLVRARWALMKEIREGRLPKKSTVMSEALIAALIVVRDAPAGAPLLVSNGRALGVVPLGKS